MKIFAFARTCSAVLVQQLPVIGTLRGQRAVEHWIVEIRKRGPVVVETLL